MVFRTQEFEFNGVLIPSLRLGSGQSKVIRWHGEFDDVVPWLVRKMRKHIAPFTIRMMSVNLTRSRRCC